MRQKLSLCIYAYCSTWGIVGERDLTDAAIAALITGLQKERSGKTESLLLSEPERSDRSIAKETGQHHKTISKKRKDLESEGEVATVATSIGLDGKTYPRTPRTPGERNAKEKSQGDDVRRVK